MFPYKELICKNIIIDHEAGEIIHLVASVHPSICLSVNTHTSFLYWCGVVDIGTLPSTAKSPVKHKSATLLTHRRVFISRSIQNGWAFKMVVVSTGCAITVDHAFNMKLMIANCR